MSDSQQTPSSSSNLPFQLTWQRFESLSEPELRLILQWRNHPKIRKWMRTDDCISEATHFAFVQSLKQSATNAYFLLKWENQPFGVADFYDITSDNQSAYFGYYMDPEKIGSSFGFLMEYWVCVYAFTTLKLDRLYAETLPSNRSASELHQHFGFENESLNTDHLMVSALQHTHWLSNKAHILKTLNRFFS